MAAKEQPKAKEAEPEKDEVVEEKKQEPKKEPTKIEDVSHFQLQIVAESQVRYDEFCGFGVREAGNTWIRLVAPDNTTQSWGYFPSQLEQARAAPTAGHVLDPSHTGYMPDRVRSYEIDAAKAALVQTVAERKFNQPGQYDILTNNCASFVQEMAEAAGVPVSIDEILLPNQKAVLSQLVQIRKQTKPDKTVTPDAEQ